MNKDNLSSKNFSVGNVVKREPRYDGTSDSEFRFSPLFDRWRKICRKIEIANNNLIKGFIGLNISENDKPIKYGAIKADKTVLFKKSIRREAKYEEMTKK